MRLIKGFVVAASVAASLSVAHADDEQVNEAAVVFDGVRASEMRGGTWKVVYSSAEGPQGRALETLTERLGPYFLREGHLATALVLPLALALELEPELAAQPTSANRPATITPTKASKNTVRIFDSFCISLPFNRFSAAFCTTK